MTDAYYVPQLPWFTQFFQHWQRSPERILIRDLETGKEASVTEFLYDVIRHGSYLRSQLSEEIQSQLRDPNEEVFIAIVASAGLGAIAVPLSM
ncbi:hypothetical protein AnigIFM56816_009833 [Aspergillus niger]|nr:hypothetical protein AnigIFM56816_009833 [Aspergillus niger]